MDEYENHCENRIDGIRGGHQYYSLYGDDLRRINGRRPKGWRSPHRQWDYIVCTVCLGCGKPLGRYENMKRLAFCENCREILYPETVRHGLPEWKKARSRC